MCFQFESPQIQSNQFEYLVRCFLVQLCVASERGRNTASPSALSHWTGLAKVGVTGDHGRLCQSTYEKVSDNGPVSVFGKVAI